MSQWAVQLVIGRLVTDGAFRRRVERGGSAYLAGLRTEGIELTRMEIAALIEIDPHVWATVAKHIDFGSNSRATAADERSRLCGTMTKQQQRVLAGICDGLRNRDIAVQLGISEGAVKATIQQLFHKLSVRRRVQLIRLVLDEQPWRSSRQRTGRRSLAAIGAHDVSEGSIAHAP